METILSQPRNKIQLIELIKILQQCKMVKQCDISNLAITLIGEFSLGCIVSCECKNGEVLILPSMEKNFKKFKCRDCNGGICVTIKCNNCIDEENLFSYPPKNYQVPYPAVSCIICSFSDDTCSICPNCSFICKGCLDFYCKRYHLKQICPTCGSEYCDKEEWDFSVCIDCNQIICTFCKSVLCPDFGKRIDCGELYDVCRSCYSVNISKYYPETATYKSCIKIINILKEYLSIPRNIIEIIAIFVNE